MTSKGMQILLLGTFILCTVQPSFGIWRADRRPKVMGEKIPLRALVPNTKELQKRIVTYHNHFRATVVPRAANMLRLKWHNGAAKAAQHWADECMFLTHDNFTGRHIESYGVCGQNIFVSSHQVPWLFAVKTWYLEKDNFTYGRRKNNGKLVGHYTQMVWAATHEIGCGFAKCFRNGNSLGKVYYNYVCNYCPMGNRNGQLGMPYKRGKPCGMCKNSCHNKKLCTNSCPMADLWANCKELHKVWPKWLCSTHTGKGKDRLLSCGATCTCKGKIHD